MEQNSRLSKRSPLHTLLSSLVLRLCHCYLYIGETLYYISSSFISQVTTVFDSWRNKLDMCHGLPANQSHLIYTLWIFFFFFCNYLSLYNSIFGDEWSTLSSVSVWHCMFTMQLQPLFNRTFYKWTSILPQNLAARKCSYAMFANCF